MLQGVYEREPYAGFALSVDCDKFERNLKGRMNLCKKDGSGVRLIMFKPNTLSLRLMGHEVMGSQTIQDITDNTDINVVAKRIR
jgi:hypothetical protein